MEPNHHFLDAVLASCKGSPSVQKVFDCLNSATNRRLLLACSGGADSIFLLHVLLAYAANKPTYIVLAHYNHAWRPAADDDARFVACLAQRWNLPCVIEKNRLAHDLPFSETTARELRLDFLRKKACEHRCEWIVFGHQMNDIVETQLLRIARGAGTVGLAAPRTVHVFKDYPNHLRPLLGLKADTIRSMLKTAGIPWQEDCSNQDDSIQRNAVRHRVVPEMRAVMDRDILVGAAKTRERIEEDAEALECWSLETYKAIRVTSWCLNLARLRPAPVAIVRRCLYLWLREHFDVQKLRPLLIEALLQAIVDREKVFTRSLGQFFISVDGDCLRLINNAPPCEKHEANYLLPLTVGGTIRCLRGATLSVEQVDLTSTDLKRILAGQVNCAHEAYVKVANLDQFLIRYWQPGDRYRPLGFAGSKKLKACFREQKLSKMERSILPIVTIENSSIVWVPYLPPAENFKLDTKAKTALRLTYESSKAP